MNGTEISLEQDEPVALPESNTPAGVESVDFTMLFTDSEAIGRYGRSAIGQDAMAEFSNLMEGSPVSRLASSLAEIIAKLSDADPKKITEKPSWFARIRGSALEAKVRYHVARDDLEKTLEEAEGAAQGVRDAVAALNRLMEVHKAEAEHLQSYINAGRDYLDQNPDAGKPDASELTFDNPRERFARRLANLATLLASHEMSLTQMKLTRAQAVDLLDRFEETSRVLIPVWRQHTLALATTKHMSQEMLAEATKAHDALMNSLTMNKNGLDN
jgi:uncharacterized protein YaaN involved in tellurite resistance